MAKLIKLLLIILLLSSPVWAGVDFDDTDDKLDCVLTGIPTSYPVTIYAAVKPSTFNNSESATAFGYSNTGSGEQYYYVGFSGDVASELRIRGAVRNSTFLGSDGATDVSSMDFATIIFVAASSTDRRIYLNGVEDGDNTTSLTFPTGLNDADIGSFQRISGITDPASGVVSEVAIWGSELTTAEVLQLGTSQVRHMPLQIDNSNLVAYWTLDNEEDGTNSDGDVFIDLKGQDNNCTGDDGANNTGLAAVAEGDISYP